MPVIDYNATGDATEAEMDSTETAARDWRDGANKVLFNIDKRYDVDAMQIHLQWTVSDSEVEDTITSLDNAIQSLGAELPLASDAATVLYGES